MTQGEHNIDMIQNTLVSITQLTNTTDPDWRFLTLPCLQDLSPRFQRCQVAWNNDSSEMSSGPGRVVWGWTAAVHCCHDDTPGNVKMSAAETDTETNKTLIHRTNILCQQTGKRDYYYLSTILSWFSYSVQKFRWDPIICNHQWEWSFHAAKWLD